MVILLLIFLFISFFEIFCMFKKKEQKEAVVYIVLAGLTTALALFLIFFPKAKSLSKTLLDLFGIE